MDLNRSATADAITAGLQWLVSSAVPGDEIVFSYSGHGAKGPVEKVDDCHCEEREARRGSL